LQQAQGQSPAGGPLVVRVNGGCDFQARSLVAERAAEPDRTGALTKQIHVESMEACFRSVSGISFLDDQVVAVQQYPPHHVHGGDGGVREHHDGSRGGGRRTGLLNLSEQRGEQALLQLVTVGGQGVRQFRVKHQDGQRGLIACSQFKSLTHSLGFFLFRVAYQQDVTEVLHVGLLKGRATVRRRGNPGCASQTVMLRRGGHNADYVGDLLRVAETVDLRGPWSGIHFSGVSAHAGMPLDRKREV